MIRHLTDGLWRLWAVLILAFGLLHIVPQAGAQERHALVIGNSGYKHISALKNPMNDALAIGEALNEAGFDVSLSINAGVEQMRRDILNFTSKLAPGDVGLFFFAGHGVQANGVNYLIPVDSNPGDDIPFLDEVINAGDLARIMKEAGNGLNILILDACRNNPFPPEVGVGVNQGLARVDSGAGMFISYSTSPGSVALDGADDNNSPYTRNLVRALKTPGLSLETTFKQALKGVYQDTEGKQVPWISSSFFGEFAFLSAANDNQVAHGQTTQATPAFAAAPRDVATAALANLPGIYYVEGSNPNGSRYSGMAAVTLAPNETARVEWWIGKDYFVGTGPLDGRWLRVDWGSNAPVIYTLQPDGTLQGTWADGSADDVLRRVATGRIDERGLAGQYQVAGQNPDGSRYSGTVGVSARGDGKFDVQWSVGGSGYRGVGIVTNGLFGVDWGDSTPVIYGVAEDGSIAGLWSAGGGTEIWRR